MEGLYEKLSKEYIEKELKASGISLKVEIIEETASTNTLLSEYAKAGIENKAVTAEKIHTADINFLSFICIFPY